MSKQMFIKKRVVELGGDKLNLKKVFLSLFPPLRTPNCSTHLFSEHGSNLKEKEVEEEGR